MYFVSACFSFLKDRLYLRAKMECRGQRQSLSLELRTRTHHLTSSDGPGQAEKKHERTGHTRLPMERVRKPIPESETLGWVSEGCSAGNTGRETGHSLCVGTGPLCPAHRR